MNLSEHFTLAEFVATQHRNIDNTLPAKLMPQALETAAMLERIRTVLSSIAGHDAPVLISSGYRCPALNAAVGGSPNSDHLKAMAPRIDALGIGQLIHEFGRWVHTSSRTPALASNRVITITAAGTRLGIQEV